MHGKVDFMPRHGKKGTPPPHQSLIVTLHIAESPFIPAVVGQLVIELKEIPLLIPDVQHLEPVIGHSHGHAHIKSDAPFLNGSGKAGHTAHIFSDGHCIGPHLMYHHIGQSQITEGIFIHIAVKILIEL